MEFMQILPKYSQLKPDVYIVQNQTFALDNKIIEEFKDFAFNSTRKQARLCLHSSEDDYFNEMLIVYHKECNELIQKRKNGFDKKIVIEGTANYKFFDYKMRMLGAFKLKTGEIFYMSSDESAFHQLEVISDFFIFIEIANGPFNPLNHEILVS